VGFIHILLLHQSGSRVFAAAPMLATEGLADTWWIFLVLFLAVTAAWAGVPVIGGVAAGTAGALASQGKLGLSAVIVIVAIAGELGGLIGYRIGFRWGRSLVERPGKRLESREKALATGERIYAKWGRLAVFVTPAIISGTAGMRLRQFVVWNFVAALGFALFTVAGAYGIGRLLTGHHTTRDILILVVGIGVGWALYRVARHFHPRHPIDTDGHVGPGPPGHTETA
jgi:membrane protein DedA with SNARE-associated domain